MGNEWYRIQANPGWHTKNCGYKYYSYTNYWVNGGMTIGNDLGKIIKGLEVNYVLQGIKGIYNKGLFYLVSWVFVYDVEKLASEVRQE